MTRRFLLLSVIFLFALPHARADEVSKRAKIEEMFNVLHIDKTMKQMMDMGFAQGRETAKSMMGDHPITPADQKIIDDSMAKLSAVIADVLSWENLKPAYVDLYAANYTEEEVDGILVFYKSPVGQALLAKTPELITKSSAIVSDRMKELGPRMQQVMADLQQQIRAAHPNKN